MEKQNMRKIKAIGLLAAIFIMGGSHSAFAVCSNPAGVTGEQIFNTDFSVMQYCDGTDWTAMRGDGDTLSNLTCTNGQVAKWNNTGSIWECAADASGSGGDDLGNHTATTALDLATNKIINLGTPTAANDATTKTYVDTAVAAAADNLGAGGTTTGTLYTSNGNVGFDSGDRIRFIDNTRIGFVVNSIEEMRLTPNALSLYTNRIIGMGDPTDPQDAATKAYVDANESDVLAGLSCTDGQVAKWNNTGTVWECSDDTAGSGADDLGNHTATTALDLATNKIVNLADPTDPQDGATKAYVDAAVVAGADDLGNHTATTNLIMGNNKVTGLGTPTDPADATTKAYVDAEVAGVVATPAGADTQVQFNDGGTLGADSVFTFDKTAKALYLTRSNTGDTFSTGLNISSTETSASTYNRGLNSRASGNASRTIGVHAEGRGTGSFNYGFQGSAEGAASSNYGLSVYSNSATSSNYGVQGYSAGSTGSTNYGGHFRALTTGATTNYGVYAQGAGSSNNNNYGIFAEGKDATYNNYGVYGQSTTTTTGNNFGGYFSATNGATNWPLYVAGNAGLAAGSYINFGATSSTPGATGYGFRDNAGVLEYKDSGGSWVSFGAGSDTLAGLSCAIGEVPEWNGSAWVCATNGSGGGGGDDLGNGGSTTGTLYSSNGNIGRDSNDRFTFIDNTRIEFDVGGTEMMRLDTASLELNGNKITDLGAPTLDADATTKLYVDTAISGASDNLGNHTATTALAMATNKITGLGDPTLAQDAATKAYVDTEISGLTDNDTLAGLSCTDGQVAKWNNTGTIWECADDDAGTGADDLGNHTATTVLDLATNKIINLGTPTAANDATTKTYVDTAVAAAADNLGAGGTTTGTLYTTDGNVGLDNTDRITFVNNSRMEFDVNGVEKMRLIGSGLDLNGNLITDLADPTGAQHAATKAYVDAQISSGGADNLGDHLATTALNLATNKIINLGTPTLDADAATKLYVDTAVAATSDADTLDTLDSLQFIRSDAPDIVSANTIWTDDSEVRLGTDSDFRMDFNGTNTTMRSFSHGSRWILQGEDTAGTNRNMIVADPDNTLTLYHNGDAKLATAIDGVSITGKITGLTDPTLAQDAATKAYVDAQISSGGADNLGNHTATTALDLATNKIINLGTPTAANDATTKTYVDTAVAAAADNLGNHTASTDIIMGTNKITGMGDPTLAQDAATKAYVDATVVSAAANADTLDTLDSSQFIRSDANDAVSAHTEWQDNFEVRLGDAADMRIYHDGTVNLIRSTPAGTELRIQGRDTGGTIRNMIRVNPDTGVSLAYSTGTKLQTTTDGVSVTGKITDLTDPTLAQDAATKAYVDAQVTAGGADNLGNHTATTTLAMGSNNITGTGDISAGSLVAGTITATAGAGISWENGTNNITNNDGGGNVQIRFGHDYSASDERFTHGGGAAFIGSNIDATSGTELTLRVASNPGAGDDAAITWGSALDISATDITFGGTSLLTGTGDNLGDHTATTALDLATNKIVNLADPTNAQDAATKAYVDAQVTGAGDDLGAGGTTTGTLYTTDGNVGLDNTDRITFVNNSRMEFDVNGVEKMRLIGSGLDLNGNLITDLADPTGAQHAATKAYVDAQVSAGGGDSDTLDTLDSLQFLRSDVDDTAAGTVTFTNPIQVENTFDINGSGPGQQQNGLYVASLDGTSGTTLNPTFTAAIVGQNSGARSVALTVDANGYLHGFRSHSSAGTYTFDSKTKYADNADTLDTLDSSQFIRSDANDAVSAHTEWGDNFEVRLGDAADMRIYHDGTRNYIRSNPAGTELRIQGRDTGGTLRNMLVVNPDTGVSLSHSDGMKLQTTTDGVAVTGKITDLTDPTLAQDAATKAYVDAQVTGAGDDLGAGGTTTGTLYTTDGNVGRDSGDQITFVNNDRMEFDIAGAEKMRLTSTFLDVAGNRIVGLADPIADQNAATKAYVDAQISGTGDDLGDHTATTALNMANNAINNAGVVTASQLVWEDGVNRITNNDGAGNVQIRFGHDYSTSDERFTHVGGAAIIRSNIDATSNTVLELAVANNPGAGNDAPLTWGSALEISATDITFGGTSLLTGTGDDLGAGGSGDLITDGTIDSTEIEDNTLTADDLAPNSVGASEIAAGAVGASELADNSVNSNKIVNNSVTSGDINDGTIQAADLNATLLSDLNDADTIDGIDSAAFIRSDADDDVSAHTEWQDNFQVRLGNDADFRVFHNGTNHVIRGYKHGAAIFIQAEDLSGTNRTLFYADPDNEAILHYAGAVKLSTTSTGIQVDDSITFSGTLTDTSDVRLKNNITPLRTMGSLLDKVTAIDTISFTMKDDANEKVEYGVKAQQLETIFPELVETADDEIKTKSVNYLGLIAPIIESIKELKNSTVELFDVVSKLKKENAKLKQQHQEILERLEKLEKESN